MHKYISLLKWVSFVIAELLIYQVINYILGAVYDRNYNKNAQGHLSSEIISDDADVRLRQRM